MVLSHRTKSRGAVSIFIVIFSTLLISTIVVGFVRLMINGQQQATAADLSQSALNSAQAGVEDAKRLLVWYGNSCLGASPSSVAACNEARTALNSGGCDTLQKAGIVGGPDDKEIVVQQTNNAADAQLQQAYTCVKVQVDTEDYIGELRMGKSRMVALKGAGDFDRVEVEWFSQEDLKRVADDAQVELAGLNDSSLPKLSEWNPNRPALLRAQLIQFGNDFKLSDFDKTDEGTSNAHTLFLNPAENGATESLSFENDERLTATATGTVGSLYNVACDQDFSTTTDKQYACKAIIALPAAVGQADPDRLKRTAYLRLDALYNDNTSFRIRLLNGPSMVGSPSANMVQFSSVQPVVDSTGRANDLFRRIQSRVEIASSTFPFPQSSIDLSGGFCKAFRVTDNPNDYSDPCNTTATP